MIKITNLLKMELYKLSHSTQFKVLLALTLILSLFFVYLMKNNEDGWQVQLAAALKDSALGDILMCIFAGLFIGNEFSSKIINLEIISGHSRRNILLSKTFSFLIGLGIIITIFPVILVIGALVLQRQHAPFSFNDFIYILRVLTFNLVIHLQGAGFLLLIGFIFRNSGKIISAAIIILLTKTILTNLLLAKYEATSCINQYFSMFQIDLVLYNDISIVVFCKAIIFSLLVFTFLFSITNLIFKNLELR